MRVFKRGRKYYSYEFELNGVRYKKSTKCTNATDARNIATAERMRIINEAAGIETPKQDVPTFREFRSTFLEWVNSELDNWRTQKFYKGYFDLLLRYDGLAGARLDQIDERVVEGFKIWMRTQVTRVGKPSGKAGVNRALQTLKKALRFARDILKLIDRVPLIKMLPGERIRDYIFTDQEFKQWIELCPEPLRSASVIARWTGVSRNEMIALQKDSVSILDDPDGDGFYGDIIVKRGLKRDSRRRTLKVNLAVRDVLRSLLENSRCDHVFTGIRDHGRALCVHRLSRQMRRVKRKGNFHSDAGLHALRHTFLTEMGELTDPYTLQRIAGHSNITTTMRYVHPQKRAMDSAFRRLFDAGQSNETSVTIVELAPDQLEKLLAGSEISLRVAAGTRDLRLKSTQKPPVITVQESSDLVTA